MNKRKIKVVWLCPLNNKLITNSLNLKIDVEYAPWISQLINIFSEYSKAEIHVVSPNWHICKIKYFKHNGIHYHFFPVKIFPGKSAYSTLLHFQINFFIPKYFIKNIIKRINPDLIHLFGSENPYYSSGILQFKNKYPVLMSVQGFASCQKFLHKKNHRKRVMIEQRIIQKFNNFGVRDEAMKNFISFLNTDANFYWHEMPVIKPDNIEIESKKYDFIFFSRVTKDKGIEDLIKALSIIKRFKKNISLCVIGQISEKYTKTFYNLISEYDLKNNIFYKGALNYINDVHKIAIMSKVSVLPTWADTIPGTIIESMFMKIPCVSYNTGGIPTLNEKKETIKLVERGDIVGLARQMEFLLDNPVYSKKMAERAYEYVNNRWNDKNIYVQVSNIYEKMLNQ